MQHTFYMFVSDLREQGIDNYLLRKFLCNARKLCREEKLYVTMNNTIPKHIEDVAAIVNDIHISRSGESVVVTIDTIEGNGNIVTEGKLIEEALSNGRDYDCFFGQQGKFITLKIQPPRWGKRVYTIKD